MSATPVDPVEAARVSNGIRDVMCEWLLSHGYPVHVERGTVPVEWLRREVNALLAEPEINGRSSPHTAWNRALLAVLARLDTVATERVAS